MVDADDSYLLWGWERFLSELSSFLRETERQQGVANQAYSEYYTPNIATSFRAILGLLYA